MQDKVPTYLWFRMIYIRKVFKKGLKPNRNYAILLYNPWALGWEYHLDTYPRCEMKGCQNAHNLDFATLGPPCGHRIKRILEVPPSPSIAIPHTMPVQNKLEYRGEVARIEADSRNLYSHAEVSRLEYWLIVGIIGCAPTIFQRGRPSLRQRPTAKKPFETQLKPMPQCITFKLIFLAAYLISCSREIEIETGLEQYFSNF